MDLVGGRNGLGLTSSLQEGHGYAGDEGERGCSQMQAEDIYMST